LKPVSKSGEPGYDPGRPLIVANIDSGLRIESVGIRHWRHENVKSLCRQSTLKNVEFMDDVVSGCFVELRRENFTDCKSLRFEKLLKRNTFFTLNSLNFERPYKFLHVQ
jgi:hypothetical protein